MKKTITLLAVIFSLHAFSQSVDYKTAPSKPGSNYYDIVNQMRQNISSKKASNKFEKMDSKAEKQFERWAFFWRDRVDQNGAFPNELLGWYNVGILDENGKLNTTTSQSKSAAKLTSSELWTNIGPQSVPEANGYPNYPQMGRLTSFLRYEHLAESQNVLFVGAPVGGLWKSTDNGATWVPKLDFIAGIGVTDIKSSSDNIASPGTIYVSTGDYDASHVGSIGVLKSTDFGETFQSTGLSFSLPNNEITSNLVVIDANTVIVATRGHIKKTTDGGDTWNNVYTHLYSNGLTGKFTRHGSNIMASGSWGGLFFSTDNGTTWDVIKPTSDPGVFDRHGTTVEQSTGIFYVQNIAGTVSKYDPNAATPTLTQVGSTVAGFNAQGGYNMSLAVKDGMIISGGVDAINSDNNGGVWYTTLNNNWQNNASPGSYGHADIHDMGYLDAGYSFWAVNDGGLIYFTYPNLSSETPTVDYKSSGVLVTQLYSVAISPLSEDHIIIGNQDNDGYSLEQHDGSLKWVSALAGDGTCTAIDYTDPQIRYLGAQNGALRRTDTGFSNNYAGIGLSTPSAGAPFVWTLKMNSTIPTTLYGGFADVHKTTDKGASWTNLNSGAGKIEYIETFGNNLLVVGENSAQKSSDDGVSWSPLTEPEGFAKMNSLSLDQNNTNVIYATVSGYINGSKVFKSSDGGSTWANISTGLPNVKMTQVVFKQNQGASEILFAGTEIGVYVKVGTSDWEKLGQGLPNVNVSDIEINYTVDKLLAGTFGRGLWQINIDNATLGSDEIATTENETPVIYPNPVSDGKLNIKLRNNDSFNYMIYNVIGGLVKKGQLQPGLNTLDIHNVQSGIYVVRMTNGNHVSSQKIVIK